MNILVICHYGMYQEWAASFVHAQAKAYAALGHRVVALVPIAWGKRNWLGDRFGQQPFEQDGVTVVPLRHLSLSNFGEGWCNTRTAIAAMKRQYRRIFSDFTPDIIHAHTLGFDSDLGAWLKERLGVPLVVTTHGSDASIPYEQGRLDWIREKSDKADIIAAVSSTLADKVRASGTQTSVCTILNGFAIQNLLTGMERQPGSIIQVGHLQDQKRQAITLRAFADLQERHPEMSLTLVGKGPEREHLEALSRELGVAEAVHFTGQISNQEVLAEMAKAQFFCMPSVREGFGIVYLEAMANGCITIGTQGEGVADLIENGKNGFLVPPDDPDSIAEVVEWCLSHPVEADAIAERGRLDAMGLTWERNATAYLRLWKGIV